MKRIRLHRWATQAHPPRNPRVQHAAPSPLIHHTAQQREHHVQHRHPRQHQWICPRRPAASRRRESSAAVVQATQQPQEEHVPLNAPSPRQALHSAKLAALHARLALPSKLPLQTLARCLIHSSVDARPGYNNEPLALLGQDLLGYYSAEWLLCHYPRLPMPVLFAAQYAYVGLETLAAMRAEWGVEVVAAPGPEVDAGLLQLKRRQPGNAMAESETMRVKDMPQVKRLRSGRRNDEWNYRRGLSSRVVYDDQFGDLQQAPTSALEDSNAEPTPDNPSDTSTTVQTASATFVRALVGALYLHAGASATKTFHQQHILSRHLPLHTLFSFTHPTRDLSRLCARESLEPPVARLISETGRLSRSPVFVVGVYSGDEKIGEGAGSSLNEGRVRAAAAALRSWYLYSPPPDDVCVPSDAQKGRWKPQVIDVGEVVT